MLRALARMNDSTANVFRYHNIHSFPALWTNPNRRKSQIVIFIGAFAFAHCCVPPPGAGCMWRRVKMCLMLPPVSAV